MKRSNLLSEPCDVLYNKGKAGMADYHLLAAIGNISVDKAREILAAVNYRLVNWQDGILKNGWGLKVLEYQKQRLWSQPLNLEREGCLSSLKRGSASHHRQMYMDI